MAIGNVAEISGFCAVKAEKREDLRAATREFRDALRMMADLVGRVLESEVDASPELAAEYETASGHMLDLALCVTHIAATAKVSLD